MIAITTDGTVPPTLEAVRLGLMHDESPELHELVFSMTLPQPGGCMNEAVDVTIVTDLGLLTSYLLGANDRSLARPGEEEEFAARLGVDPIMVAGGHMTLLTQPAAVAAALTNLS